MSKLYEFSIVSRREFTEKEVADIFQIMNDVVGFYEKNKEERVEMRRGFWNGWAELYLYGEMK